MGTWDSGSFGNDTALDFVALLKDEKSIISAVQRKPAAYLDADEACETVAACDLLAAMTGRAAADMPEDAQNLIATFAAPDGKLLDDARVVLKNVRDNSELAELWDEADDEEWKQAVDGLIDRLNPDFNYVAPEQLSEPTAPIYAHCFVCEGSIAEDEAVDLVHEIDDGIIYSSMTLHAHRTCAEQKFDPPHWNSDGSPSEEMQQQFARFIGIDSED